MDGQGNRGSIGGERSEVDCVTGVANRPSDRGIDGAVGELSRTQRGGDRLTEHRRDGRLVATAARQEKAELAVVSEAAAGPVDRIDNALHRRGRALQVIRIRDDHLHEGPEGCAPVRGDGHEAPLTVLADDELPLLAEPVASGDGVAVLDVAVLGVEVVVIDVVDVAVMVPACVCAESAAMAATATIPAIPDDSVSCLRNLSARSRSATVIRRFGVSMITSSWRRPLERG